ncbi:MAG TPA: hypothetical protein VFD43_09740, partial [Planctomycetota bacterium]|nr:hypothetical protein [Planctomycetota bacterium]
MNSRPSLLPVVLAVLALPSALVGQDAGRPPAEQSAPAPDAAQVPAPAGRGAQALDRGAGETGRTPDRDAALARMRAAEEEHRERVAAIRHLRELAVRAGQAERVAQFDELEASENARFRSETEAESRKPSRKVVIRKVRTGARAAGA